MALGPHPCDTGRSAEGQPPDRLHRPEIKGNDHGRSAKPAHCARLGPEIPFCVHAIRQLGDVTGIGAVLISRCGLQGVRLIQGEVFRIAPVGERCKGEVRQQAYSGSFHRDAASFMGSSQHNRLPYARMRRHPSRGNRFHSNRRVQVFTNPSQRLCFFTVL